jgi:hypothetical protein
MHSLDRNLQTGELTVTVNSPINFAGDTGSVTVTPIPLATTPIWLVSLFTVAAIGLHRLRGGQP